MRAFLKFLFYTLLSLILLSLIGIAILIYTLNPNNLKTAITQQVKTQTGRNISISGNISWRFFPWLGFSIQGVNIQNPTGFNQSTPFIKLNQADVSIKLVPLLSRDIEFGAIKLDGLQLNLVSDAQGNNNWNYTTVKSLPTSTNNVASTNSKYSQFKIGSFKISSINISNAKVSYVNLKTKQQYNFKNFNFSSENISLNSAFPITMDFYFKSYKPDIYGQIYLNTKITLNQSNKAITISPLVFNGELNGAKLPKNGLAVNLDTDLTFSKQNDNLNISKLSGKIDNLQFNGKLSGFNLLKNPVLNGTLNINQFNPKTLLSSLGFNLPNFKNTNALNSVALNSQFIYTAKALSITNLKLIADNSTLTGNVYLAKSRTEQSKFNLNLDKIDLANFLLASNNQASATSSISTSASTSTTTSTSTTNTVTTKSNQVNNNTKQVLPIEILRQLNIVGNLAIGSLNYQKFQMSNVKLHLTANNGLIELKHNQANLYQGQWQSNIAVNMQTNQPIWQVNEVFNNVAIAPLTAAFSKSTKYQISGTGNIKSSLITKGNTATELTQNLNGTGQFAVNNGVINGINLSYQMNRAMSVINKQPSPTQPGTNQTEFGDLTGTFQINNGLITNNDLSLQSSTFQAKGQGTINLVNQQVNYHIASSAIQGQVDPKIYALQEKIGGNIPINISGTLSNLKVFPDMQAILKNMASAYVKQNSDKIKTAVDNEVQKLGGNLNSNLKNSIQNSLNSLLN